MWFMIAFHSVIDCFALQVLQEVLKCYSVPENLFGKVCVIIDKVSDAYCCSFSLFS